MLITRIAIVSLCIVSTSAVAFGQQGSPTAEPVMRVIHTSLRPDVEGRLVPSLEVVETTRRRPPAATQTIREVFDFDLERRRRLIETVESQEETLANGDMSAVHTTLALDVNGRQAVMSRQVERTRVSPSNVQRTETTLLLPYQGGALREAERSLSEERRTAAGVVGHESTYSIRDVNGRWQPVETRRGEAREVGASERIDEETIQRPDVNGTLVDAERVVTRSVSQNAREHAVIETYARSDGRLALSQRVQRTTTPASDGGRSIVEEVEGRNPVAPSEPLRVIRRIVTTVRPVRSGGWITEQEVFELDVNGRLLLVDRQLTTSS
jgi:hypothetical protein